MGQVVVLSLTRAMAGACRIVIFDMLVSQLTKRELIIGFDGKTTGDRSKIEHELRKLSYLYVRKEEV